MRDRMVSFILVSGTHGNASWGFGVARYASGKTVTGTPRPLIYLFKPKWTLKAAIRYLGFTFSPYGEAVEYVR